MGPRPVRHYPRIVIKEGSGTEGENSHYAGYSIQMFGCCSQCQHLDYAFLYGAEIAHPDIPWGIDAQELIYMMQMARMGLIDVLRAATAKAGQHLNLPLLGTLQPGAPADIIAVKGDPTHALKILEYPDLVISGGKIVVNNF